MALMKIPRIAYCSPVNPAPSGISDYSEEVLPYLGQYGDITLYVENGLRPANLRLVRNLDVQPLRTLERTHRRKPYDAILYHMGNSPVHADIWSVAQQVPGVIVMHDFVLHHFMLWYAANVQHNVQHYVTMMSDSYGEEGHHLAQLMIRGRFTQAAFNFPCCESVIAAARAVISHNRFVQHQVAAIRPDVPNVIIPMGVPLPPLIERNEARERLGLPAGALILASFGHINAYKRLEPALRAVQELYASMPNTRYILVGSVSPNYDIQALIQRMGLEQIVSLTGYVERDTFEEYVAATDICLNLRYPTSGETSASLLRLLGAGRPTLVSTTGSYAELPPHVAAQVDVDASEQELILAYCRLLAEQPDVATVLGTNARAYVAQEHTLEEAAKGYARVLAAWYGWDVVQRVHPEPLWDVTRQEPARMQQPSRQRTTPSHSSRAHDRSEHGTSQQKSHSGSWSLSHDHQQTIATVAEALRDIGITEHDDTLLNTVAHHLYDLVIPVTGDRE
jgi:glycosyltransferase involved in cell wall biosynthesis